MLDTARLQRLVELGAKLTDRQRLLADMHVKDPMATFETIGRQAGIKGKTASAVVAQVSKILDAAKVQAYLHELMAATNAPARAAAAIMPLVMDAREVKERITRLARVSWSDLMRFDDSGAWTGEWDLRRENVDGIKEVLIEERLVKKLNIGKGEDMVEVQIVDRKTKLKLEDRLRALEAMARIFKLLQPTDSPMRHPALSAYWQKWLAEHPDEARKMHLELLAIEAGEEPAPDAPRLVGAGPAVPAEGNGNGAHG